jgi:hypothetical protein
MSGSFGEAAPASQTTNLLAQSGRLSTPASFKT